MQKQQASTATGERLWIWTATRRTPKAGKIMKVSDVDNQQDTQTGALEQDGTDAESDNETPDFDEQDI